MIHFTLWDGFCLVMAIDIMMAYLAINARALCWDLRRRVVQARGRIELANFKLATLIKGAVLAFAIVVFVFGLITDPVIGIRFVFFIAFF